MEYKPTSNYVKAQSKYNIQEQDRQRLMNSLLNAYKGYGIVDKVVKTGKATQFGKQVAQNYKKGIATPYPDWLKQGIPDTKKVFKSMQDYDDVSGLMGYLKNFINPSPEQLAMREVGNLALQNTGSLMADGMESKAIGTATESTASTLLSNPITQILGAILGIGFGAGKEGSTLNKLNKELGL